jgi:putative membrane protein
MYGYGMGWWFWPFALLLLAGLVLLAVVAVRLIGGGIGQDRASTPGKAGEEGGGRSSARQILDERYARGELTTEEYQERLGVLGEGPQRR